MRKAILAMLSLAIVIATISVALIGYTNLPTTAGTSATPTVAMIGLPNFLKGLIPESAPRPSSIPDPPPTRPTSSDPPPNTPEVNVPREEPQGTDDVPEWVKREADDAEDDSEFREEVAQDAQDVAEEVAEEVANWDPPEPESDYYPYYGPDYLYGVTREDLVGYSTIAGTDGLTHVLRYNFTGLAAFTGEDGEAQGIVTFIVSPDREVTYEIENLSVDCST